MDPAPTIRRRLLDATDLGERRLELAGVPTAVLEAGSGRPLVLLHGQGEHWAVWLPVLDALLGEHHLVVVDLPGHGASLPVADRLDRARVMDWLHALLAATCPQPPIVVGHLLGGAIAARYAVDHSDELAHLVLVDTLGLGWFRPRAQFAVRMIGFMARPSQTSRDHLFRKCFVDFDRTGANFGARWDDVRDYALASAQDPAAQSALRDLVRHLGLPPIPRADLDRITVPTTLIHGRDDLQVDVDLARHAGEHHGWPLHVIDDCRDDPAAEQPDAFLTALRAAQVHAAGTSPA